MIAELDATFAALADPTRRALVERLACGEARVSDLAAPFRMSLPAVSKHLGVLESAGLIRRRREGRAHYLSLHAEPMATAAAWLERHRRFWEGSLDRLAALVAEPAPRSPNPAPPNRRRRARPASISPKPKRTQSNQP